MRRPEVEGVLDEDSREAAHDTPLFETLLAKMGGTQANDTLSSKRNPQHHSSQLGTLGPSCVSPAGSGQLAGAHHPLRRTPLVGAPLLLAEGGPGLSTLDSRGQDKDSPLMTGRSAPLALARVVKIVAYRRLLRSHIMWDWRL